MRFGGLPPTRRLLRSTSSSRRPSRGIVPNSLLRFDLMQQWSGRTESMPTADPEAHWNTVFRSFRRTAAAMSVLQMLGLLVLFVVLLFADARVKGVGYALAAGILVLEVGQWALSRAALRRCPGFEPGDRYAPRPLHPAQLRLVDFKPHHHCFRAGGACPHHPDLELQEPEAGRVSPALPAMVPSGLSLWRVRRNRSWLAISRIPASPRRRPSL